MTAGTETGARSESGATQSFSPHASIKLATSYLCLKYYLFGLRVWLRSAFIRYDFCQAIDVMSLFAARGFAARGVPLLLDVNEIPIRSSARAGIS
jgi:hypothetical protein